MEIYSVEFLNKDIFPGYIFKIRESTSSGVSILVKNNSAILGHLNVGEVMDLKYQLAESPNGGEYLKTEIQQVTKNDGGPFKGHHVVELSIMESKEQAAG